MRILLTGLLVGTLDGLAAVINYLIATGGKNPLRVFIFIASGVLGASAYGGNPAVPVLGIFLHYLIATIWAALFALLIRPRLPDRLSTLSVGPAYGVFVWAFMQFVVMPISRTPPLPFSLKGALIGIGIHIVCVGTPIALVLFSRPDTTRRP